MPELTPLTEGAETLTAHDEFAFVEALPALYPSASTFPSARTFPSSGTPRVGLWLDGLAEGSEALTPLTED